MTPAMPEAPLLSPGRTAAICAAMIALGPVSLGIYTPAMPALVEAFGTTEAVIKLTLTAYFAGFAFMQLICGPLSDVYGRRPVLIAYLVLYVAASVAAILARDVAWMLAARLIQGAGAAVGVALSRAIIRDLYTGQTSARIMNLTGMILGSAPALAPFIGGFAVEHLGWATIFVLMTAYGVLLLAILAVLLPETNTSRDPANSRVLTVFRNYAVLLRDPRFMRPSLVAGLTFGVIYTLTTMLPFIIINRVGLSPSLFGVAMLAQSGAFLVGTLITSRLLRRYDAMRIVLPGIVLAAVAGLASLLILSIFPLSLVTVIGPVAVIVLTIALVLPGLSTAAIADFPAMAGSASALMGFMQIGGGLLGSTVGAALGDPVLAMKLIIPAMPLAALAIYLAMGRPRAAR